MDILNNLFFIFSDSNRFKRLTTISEVVELISTVELKIKTFSTGSSHKYLTENSFYKIIHHNPSNRKYSYDLKYSDLIFSPISRNAALLASWDGEMADR